jgi:ectoine hydroxylase-related dioxygenase (phytanoyl-CoA dioxygenase family)
MNALEDGFGIVEGAISAERVDELTEAMAALGARHGLRNLLRISSVARLALELKPYAAAWLGSRAFAVRGLFFDKLPGANWDVAWHQDLSIAVAERREVPGFKAWSCKKGVLHVQPPVEVLEQMLAVRLHLDDCGPENGPLRVRPGSHRQGRLDDEQLARWQQTQAEAVTCCVRRGGLLLMRPLLLHASAPATHPRHRRVLHLEYASQGLPGGLRWYEEVANSALLSNP